MKEKTIDVWKKKLEWIIKNNRIVHFDVPPDHLNFSNKSNEIEEFPI